MMSEDKIIEALQAIAAGGFIDDDSDGIYIDLNRLSFSSKKHAVLDIDFLRSHLTPEVSLQIALEGGEDYGLLLTVHKDSFEGLSYRFKENFGYELKVIGYITDGEGISFKQGNQPVEIIINHFAHFFSISLIFLHKAMVMNHNILLICYILVNLV